MILYELLMKRLELASTTLSREKLVNVCSSRIRHLMRHQCTPHLWPTFACQRPSSRPWIQGQVRHGQIGRLPLCIGECLICDERQATQVMFRHKNPPWRGSKSGNLD